MFHFILQDNTWSYLVRWKDVWLHESYCVKFSSLVDEYWLQHGGNPDVVLINSNSDAAAAANTLETMFNGTLGESIQQQQEHQENTMDSSEIRPDGTIPSSEENNINGTNIAREIDEATDSLALVGHTVKRELVENIKVARDPVTEEKSTEGELILENISCTVESPDPSLNFEVDNMSVSKTNGFLEAAAVVDNVQNKSTQEESQSAEEYPQSDTEGTPKGKKYVPVECDICNKTLSSRNSLREHRITVHLKNGRFPCNECEKRFTNRRALQIHRVIHTKERNYVCELCGSTHKRPRELKLHMRDMHSEHQTYRCDVCFKCFKQKSHLKMHCFTEHEDTVTDCIVCKQKLMTPFSIYTHCLKHAGYREFECEICSRTFKTKKALTDHQKIHSQDRKPYKECPKCGKAIYSRSHYYEHVNSHDLDSNEIVRFSCSMCESTFQHTSSLKRHMLRHRTGGDLEHPKENPFLTMDESLLPSLCCRKCRRNYTSKSGYYDHIKRCRDGIISKFACDICPKVYTKRSALNRHIRTNHPEVFVAEFFDEQTTVEIVNSDQIVETDEHEVLVHVQVALAPEITDAEITEHYMEENADEIQSIEVVQTIPES